jgi:hypothetical protein
MKHKIKIPITDTRTIAEVQKDFSKVFPYLKLEFFDTPHKSNEASHKSKMYSHDKLLKACRQKHTDGSIEINEFETVSALESKLWDKFGLSAQVFRKSGNLWIETSLTDSWTLLRQNEEGREFSSLKHIAKEDLDLTDRDKWA